MPKNVQIRSLSDATYDVLRQRAEAEDLSLAQFLRRELGRLASTPATPASVGSTATTPR